MNKKLGIVIAIGLIVIGGTGTLVLLMNKSNTLENRQQTETTSPTRQAEIVSSKSAAALLAEGKDQQCTFSYDEANGTMYFTNGKMAAEYTFTADNQTRNGKMIITNNEQYFWETSSNSGVKLALSNDQNQSAQSQSDAIDINKNFNFTCRDWQVDTSLFTPPSDVTFVDLQNFNPSVVR